MTFAPTWFLVALIVIKPEVVMDGTPNRSQLSPGAFAAGMILGAMVGFGLWMATDTFVLFPAFLGMGVVFGLMFDAARRRRRS